MSNQREWAEELNGLRRFGLALVRDDRFAQDDSAAARLVDKLIRQSCVTPISKGPTPRLTGRAAAYARFVQLHRRHVRRMAMDEETASPEPAARCPGVVIGMRSLPLECREAILMVGLARFSHIEAAQALEIPIARFIERLDRGRCRLAGQMGVDIESGAVGWRGVSHLRVIK